MRIICDFDGTITRQDSTDLVLERLADPRWEAIQADWIAGRISGAECMREQIALIGGTDRDLDAVLDSVELDPGFPLFVAWCEQRGLPLAIASDGVDYFVRRILTRHGLARLPFVANAFAGRPEARRLEQPWFQPDCHNGSGVCKCAAIALEGRDNSTVIYVGDGRSDYCISGRVDVLFAKGALADHAIKRNQPYLPFDTFDDVRRSLALLIGGVPTSRNMVAGS
jgi:2,3-diketo-5-methylthio-1-phosphopentane phosphatase